MTPTRPHIIIFSHDFGVRKHDRGLFTAVARTMPDATSILFDYYPINDESNTLTAKPLGEQARKLRKVINAARAEHPGASIDLVCHGQGCVPVAILKPRDIRKIILLTPPAEVSEAAMIKQISSQIKTPIDVTVRTRLPGSNGSTTVLQPEYWQGLAGIEPIKLYNRLARFTTLRIMHARQDELQGAMDFERLDPSISAVTLDGNHSFSDAESRKRVLYILKKELSV